MKKFLKKKATMIGSIVAAAVVFILLVVFCVRPVSVGYTYKLTKEVAGVENVQKIHFNSFDKLTITNIVDDKEVSEQVMWYFVKDGVVVPCGLAEGVGSISKDQFKEAKEEVLKDWDSDDIEAEDRWNAFKAPGEDALVCVGAYVTVAVLAVVDVLLAGAAVASIVLSKKK